MTELVELKKTDLSPMVRTVNKGALVSWINADLYNRANHDVRKSIVFLDEGLVLMLELGPVAAVDPALWDQLLAKPDAEKQVTIDALYQAGARFWVRGLV